MCQCATLLQLSFYYSFCLPDLVSIFYLFHYFVLDLNFLLCDKCYIFVFALCFKVNLCICFILILHVQTVLCLDELNKAKLKIISFGIVSIMPNGLCVIHTVCMAD